MLASLVQVLHRCNIGSYRLRSVHEGFIQVCGRMGLLRAFTRVMDIGQFSRYLFVLVLHRPLWAYLGSYVLLK